MTLGQHLHERIKLGERDGQLLLLRAFIEGPPSHSIMPMMTDLMEKWKPEERQRMTAMLHDIAEAMTIPFK